MEGVTYNSVNNNKNFVNINVSFIGCGIGARLLVRLNACSLAAESSIRQQWPEGSVGEGEMVGHLSGLIAFCASGLSAPECSP